MNRVLSNKRLYSNRISNSRKAGFVVYSAENRKGKDPSGKASLSVGIFSLIIFTLLLGGVYVFQVNNVATQGIDMKKAENEVRELEQERKKLEIREVELKSMQQIEDSTQNLNLVDSGSVSYIELDGPVAMK